MRTPNPFMRHKMTPNILDMQKMTKKERMAKLVSFIGTGNVLNMDDVAKDNLELLKNEFYRNHIIEIEGKNFDPKIYSDDVFLVNSKQKKIKVILLITQNFMSIFQGTLKKTVVKKLKVDQISKLEFLEQNAVMLCISFLHK
jgi:hypothetical protein